MKIQIMSDIHLEFLGPDDTIKVRINQEADIVVLAGDLTSSRRHGIDLLRGFMQSYPNQTFLIIPGNHEYYGGVFDPVEFRTRYFDIENCVVLHRGMTLERDDIIFMGDTLWTNIGPIKGPLIQSNFSDYCVIDGLTTDITDREHKETVDFLVEQLSLAQNNNKTVVVVTHHTPSFNSVPPRFYSSPINICFSNDLNKLMTAYEPAVWIHGHTHDSFDYHIGKTRVICNPYGYEPNMINPDFIQEFTIEV